ncbi:TPA: hypothetical protein ONC26_000207 [Enterobacter roggenkampii]|nr:hypothetical protein [Enterobacter roggenkampii]
MKPTYSELVQQLALANADNQKAMESLKQADDALKLAHNKFHAMAAEVSGVIAACEHVYAAGYNLGHLHTVDGIAYKEEFAGLNLEALASHLEIPEVKQHLNKVREKAIRDALNDCSDYLDTDCVMDRLDVSYMDAELRTSGATELHDALLAVANQLRQGVEQ